MALPVLTLATSNAGGFGELGEKTYTGSSRDMLCS